jgi:hypothetical protein
MSRVAIKVSFELPKGMSSYFQNETRCNYSSMNARGCAVFNAGAGMAGLP